MGISLMLFKKLSDSDLRFIIYFKYLLIHTFFQIGCNFSKQLAVLASEFKNNKKMKQLNLHLDSPEGKLDKNGNLRKYTRDHESDWTIKNNKPHYGIKEHTAVDTKNGFILSTTLSPSSHNDSKYLPYAVCYSMHADKIQITYADKGYTGALNREFLALNKI